MNFRYIPLLESILAHSIVILVIQHSL